MQHRNLRERKGMAIILAALMLAFTIPVVGLAVDAGLLFVVKGRLSAAVDSAALAAGRALNLGNDLATVQASALASANRFFDANFPAGYLGTAADGRTVTADFQLQRDASNNPTGILIISVTGTVNSPTYFMRIFGVNGVDVSATGTATRRNLVMMMLLDQSGSMGSRVTSGIPTTLPSNAKACDAMVQAAAGFVDYFSPYDTVGLVTFNAQAAVTYAPSTNFKNSGSSGINSKIGAINCSGSTATTAAIHLSGDQVFGVGQKLAMNTIVLFTDGMPNGVVANFPTRTQVDTRLGPGKTYSSLPSNTLLRFRDPSTPSGSNPLWVKDASAPANNYINCTTTDGPNLCYKLPLPATGTTPATAYGQISQGSFDDNENTGSGLIKAYSTDTLGTFPTNFNANGSNKVTAQNIAYIPDVDAFGNSNRGNWDNWHYHANNQCAPTSVSITPGSSRCKDIGGTWAAYPTGAGSNFLPSPSPYAAYLRPELGNSIAAAGMNASVDQARRIRADTDYNIMFNAIYLLGNDAADPAEREFLPRVVNLQMIPPLVYQPIGTAPITNTGYIPAQQTGMFVATADVRELNYVFAQIASSLLRLSQ
jgi:Flp pilus assembly protein TadG